MTVKRKLIKYQQYHSFLKKAWYRTGEGILAEENRKNNAAYEFHVALPMDLSKFHSNLGPS